MKFNHVLIDGDILVYRIGFSIEKFNKETNQLEVEPVHHAYYNINNTIDKIFKRTQADSYEVYLTASGKGNFRYSICPDYKINRLNSRKPVFYNEIRDYLTSKYEAIIIDGQEADDSISIEQYKRNSLGFDKDIKNSIICSIDKDFNNVPGWHFNYVKDEIYYVTETEALRNFYLQILTGDVADSISRIKKGWRKKEIETALSKVTDESLMYQIVLNEINRLHELDRKTIEDTVLTATGCKVTDWNTYRKMLSERDLRLRGRLVHLRRYPEEMWDRLTLNKHIT